MRTTETNEAGLIARILAGEKELFHELIGHTSGWCT